MRHAQRLARPERGRARGRRRRAARARPPRRAPSPRRARFARRRLGAEQAVVEEQPLGGVAVEAARGRRRAPPRAGTRARSRSGRARRAPASRPRPSARRCAAGTCAGSDSSPTARISSISSTSASRWAAIEKPEPQEHARAVGLDRHVDEVAELGEGDDVVEALLDLLALEAVQRAVEEDVLAAARSRGRSRRRARAATPPARRTRRARSRAARSPPGSAAWRSCRRRCAPPSPRPRRARRAGVTSSQRLHATRRGAAPRRTNSSFSVRAAVVGCSAKERRGVLEHDLARRTFTASPPGRAPCAGTRSSPPPARRAPPRDDVGSVPASAPRRRTGPRARAP